MYDAIYPQLLPAGAAAYAGYVGGAWPTYNTVRAEHPRADVLSIAINAAEAAECLDIESGDATIDDAPGWHQRATARGVAKPVMYSSVSNMGALLTALATAGIPRTASRLWSAHYGSGAHVCGPDTCAFKDAQGRALPPVDGTQWTDTAGGQDVDASLLGAGFFDQAATMTTTATPLEADVYQGQIPAGTPIGVPVVIGSVNRCALYADFTGPKAPLTLRVAVRSAAKGYSQIVENAVLNASEPYYIDFAESDVCAVSFRRTDTDSTRTVGYFVTG